MSSRLFFLVLFLLLHDCVSNARSPPQLPRQFQAEIHVISHLADPRQDYPFFKEKMQVYYDYQHQVAKAEMLEGVHAGKTFVRLYNQKQEFMINSGDFKKCERAYLGTQMPVPEIPFPQTFLAMESIRGNICEHWVHSYENTRVHVFQDVALNVPIRLTEEHFIDGHATMLRTFDLHHVHVGPQHSSHFALPDGYKLSDCVRNIEGFPSVHAFHYYLKF